MPHVSQNRGYLVIVMVYAVFMFLSVLRLDYLVRFFFAFFFFVMLLHSHRVALLGVGYSLKLFKVGRKTL